MLNFSPVNSWTTFNSHSNRL